MSFIGYKIILIFATLFLPFMTLATDASGPGPDITQPANQAVKQYASDVRDVWTSYQVLAIQLTQILSQVATDPLVVRQEAFANSLHGLTAQIRFVRRQLDAVPSPEPVERIHEDLESASDLFDVAADKLARFAESHDLDDFADAYEAVLAGTIIWTKTLQELAELVDSPPLSR